MKTLKELKKIRDDAACVAADAKAAAADAAVVATYFDEYATAAAVDYDKRLKESKK